MNIRLVAQDSSRKAIRQLRSLEIGIGCHTVKGRCERLTMQFDPSRQAGLKKLHNFATKAAKKYAATRNFDLTHLGHPNVSGLSPYLRTRMISEAEVIQTILANHSAETADKFIQEVFWRTYWKGWLEQRPQIWGDYKTGLKRALDDLQTQSGLRSRFDDACLGQTDIECFNSWAQDIVRYGYLHNHARMWFASIWIFTLRLPWELGADFFMRHLLDGDAASNTLSWRWVAGLQTEGKTYLARADNIAKFTDGRFSPSPSDLSSTATPLVGTPKPMAEMPTLSIEPPTVSDVGLIITDEDLSPEFLIAKGLTPKAIVSLNCAEFRSPLTISSRVAEFTRAAMSDATQRMAAQIPSAETDACDGQTNIQDIEDRLEIQHWITAYAPVGPVQDHLRLLSDSGIHIHQVAREYDKTFWPHATAGFFKFRKQIPELINYINALET